MTFECDRRMRLQFSQDQVEQIAQLKAHYSAMGGGFIPAHLVIRWAINELHHKTFVKEDHSLPADWRHYEK